MGKVINIGLIGFGTIGTGVVQTLQRNGKLISGRVGAQIRLRKIADLDIQRDRGVHVDPAVLTTNAEEVLNDPDIAIVIELMGGCHPAREFILRGIEQGKSIVTANKALLAGHGQEIFEAVEAARGVAIGYEASVGGGIPVIRAVREGFAGDEIVSIRGIVNGTANYILSGMSDDGKDFKEALQEAQRRGFAEADPGFDIDGTDSAHKIAILSMLAFGAKVPLERVHREGIAGVTPDDIGFAAQFGCRIKLLALARQCGDSLDIRVHPAMIPVGLPIANINGATNAIEIRGNSLGVSLLVGEGAGSLPTASAVMGDVIEIARGILSQAEDRLPPRSWQGENIRDLPIKPMDAVESEYYLRFHALDQPGVLSRISGILGSHDIGIASVIQKERREKGAVPVVILTHLAVERNIRLALEAIDQLAIIPRKTFYLRMETRA